MHVARPPPSLIRVAAGSHKGALPLHQAQLPPAHIHITRRIQQLAEATLHLPFELPYVYISILLGQGAQTMTGVGLPVSFIDVACVENDVSVADDYDDDGDDDDDGDCNDA